MKLIIGHDSQTVCGTTPYEDLRKIVSIVAMGAFIA